MLEFGTHSLGSVLCKRKKCSAKSVLEFGTHSLGSVLCNRKRNLFYGVYKTFTRFWRTFLKFAKVRGIMADSRRQTRCTRRRGSQTDAQFWSNQPDPLLIERGHADAIRLVRSTVNTASGTIAANEPTEANATNVSGVPQMVFVDDEGLEEQFLTDGEDTTNIQDTSANRVTTPVNTTPTNRSIQQIQHEELDLQPS